jgi:polyisoprenoid-binding protein YceI
MTVDRSADRVARFISSTPVDEFDGVTENIDGYVLLDGQPLTASTGGDDTELYLEVDLASIDTGIGLRNRHMRDNYLEVEEFPYASFRGRITDVRPTAGGGGRVTASGTFSVHGVSREREIACDVAPAGRGYRARCAFPVLLTDHDIEIPKVMFLKLADEVQVEVEFTVAPADSGAGGKP